MDIWDLGRIDYEKAWEIQLDCVAKRAEGRIPDTLLLCEHDPVYTFGRNHKGPVPDALPFPARRAERGGKVTYHGPGQLVLYPIVKLEPFRILPFIRSIENFLIDLLVEHYDLSAGAREGETGVWIGNRKIASIGIAVRRWVSFHGAALNVDPDLTHFSPIDPCGYSPDVMTSLARELGRRVAVEEVKRIVTARNLFSGGEVHFR